MLICFTWIHNTVYLVMAKARFFLNYFIRAVQVTRLPYFVFLSNGCVFFSVCGQHANVCSYSRLYMCRYATPYPCFFPAWNTNRQHAHDT